MAVCVAIIDVAAVSGRKYSINLALPPPSVTSQTRHTFGGVLPDSTGNPGFLLFTALRPTALAWQTVG